VYIRLRSDSAFDLASMRDIEVYIGNTNPIQVDGTTVFVSTNALCRRKAGQLGTRKGELVVLGCGVPMSGRYVGIQME